MQKFWKIVGYKINHQYTISKQLENCLEADIMSTINKNWKHLGINLIKDV